MNTAENNAANAAAASEAPAKTAAVIPSDWRGVPADHVPSGHLAFHEGKLHQRYNIVGGNDVWLAIPEWTGAAEGAGEEAKQAA